MSYSSPRIMLLDLPSLSILIGATCSDLLVVVCIKKYCSHFYCSLIVIPVQLLQQRRKRNNLKYFNLFAWISKYNRTTWYNNYIRSEQIILKWSIAVLIWFGTWQKIFNLFLYMEAKLKWKFISNMKESKPDSCRQAQQNMLRHL